MSIDLGKVVAESIDGTLKKSKTSHRSLIIKAMFAGVFIGMGAAGSNVAAHSLNNVGLARALTGLVFPVGLMLVVTLGAELFTGNSMAVMAVSDKKINWRSLGKIWITVYAGNLFGAIIFALAVSFSGQLDYSSGLLGAFTIKIAQAKVSIPFEKAVVSGILCNILVCGAVLIAGSAKEVFGKIWICFFVIMLFATSGYEHCVANMYYLTAGLIAKMNPHYVQIAVETFELSQESIDSLNVGNAMIRNLIPVTIGNMIGGSLIMGLPVYYLNRSGKP